MGKFESRDKELLVRKRMASFIEKLFVYFGYDIGHDVFKEIIYNERSFFTGTEEKIKRAYDAYYYLLSNARNPLTSRMVNTFFYIYFSKEIENSVAIRISNDCFKYIDGPIIEKAIDFHMEVYNEIDFAGDEAKTIISLMFFNYMLVKEGVPCIHLSQKQLNVYKKKREEYLNGSRSGLYVYMETVILGNKTQSKSYYDNLRMLSLHDVYQTLKNDESYIIKTFGIKHISVFGSFSKGIEWIDSDIDLLVSFSLDMTTEEKRERTEEFKRFYFNKFDRFVDVSEVSDYLNDEFLIRT